MKYKWLQQVKKLVVNELEILNPKEVFYNSQTHAIYQPLSRIKGE